MYMFVDAMSYMSVTLPHTCLSVQSLLPSELCVDIASSEQDGDLMLHPCLVADHQHWHVLAVLQQCHAHRSLHQSQNMSLYHINPLHVGGSTRHPQQGIMFHTRYCVRMPRESRPPAILHRQTHMRGLVSNIRCLVVIVHLMVWSTTIPRSLTWSLCGRLTSPNHNLPEMA